MGRFRAVASIAVASLALDLVALASFAPAASAAPTTLVHESFAGASTTSPQWTLPATSGGPVVNAACLTGSTDTTSTPIPGCATPGAAGGLQLTTDGLSQEGGLAYSSSVPSSLGLDVTFDSYQ